MELGNKDFYVHPKALVETENIGKNTRVWPFSHIAKEVAIGEDCNVGEHSYIESGVTVGDRVTIKNGVCIWKGVELEDDVFVGPNAVFTNELYPRSKKYSGAVSTRVGKGASVGANATIVCGIEIGEYAMIGAGSVVTKNVPSNALVYGNPAKVKEFICRCGDKLSFASELAECQCGSKYKFNK